MFIKVKLIGRLQDLHNNQIYRITLFQEQLYE